MMVKALRNTTNRPLELIFGEQSERIPKGQVGKFHSEKEWKGSFAEKQADEFVKRHEAKFIINDTSKLKAGSLADPSLKQKESVSRQQEQPNKDKTE